MSTTTIEERGGCEKDVLWKNLWCTSGKRIISLVGRWLIRRVPREGGRRKLGAWRYEREKEVGEAQLELEVVVRAARLRAVRLLAYERKLYGA